MVKEQISYVVTVAKEQADQALSQLKENFRSVEMQTQSYSKSIDSARYANMNFNRLVSDSPYLLYNFQTGLMGISNNIEPFVQSMVKIRQETGSWGSATKSLLSSFLGTGGFLSVVSLAVAGVQALSFIFGSAKKEAKELTNAIEEQNKKLSESTDIIYMVDLLNRRTLLQKKIDRANDPLSPQSTFNQKDRFSSMMDLANTKKELEEINRQLDLMFRGKMGDILKEADEAAEKKAKQAQKEAQKRYEQLQDSLKSINSLEPTFATKQEETALKGLDSFLNRLKANLERQGIEWNESRKAFAIGLYFETMSQGEKSNKLGVPRSLKETQSINKPKLDFHIDKNDIREEFGIFSDLAESFGDTLTSAGKGAFHKIFGEANSLFEQLVEGFFNRMLERASSGFSDAVFGGLLSLLPGGGFLSSLFGSNDFAGIGSGRVTPGGAINIGLEIGQAVMNKTVRIANNRNARLRLA